MKALLCTQCDSPVRMSVGIDETFNSDTIVRGGFMSCRCQSIEAWGGTLDTSETPDSWKKQDELFGETHN